MIIPDRSFLHSVKEDGDKLVFNHMKDVTASLKQASTVRRVSDNGWTQDRSMRQIGCIDEVAYQKLCDKHPEVLRNPELLKEWLETPEGEVWRTVDKINSNRSGGGRLIVK